ncbi:MAG: hypothetical protein V4436_03175 [Patescibacteria group bacterium]
MKSMYDRMYNILQPAYRQAGEGFAVFAITLAVVVAYSFWGAYLLHGDDATPQVVTVER